MGNYINPLCFAAPPVFSADDPTALGFGNSGVGILDGPGQHNWDVALLKKFKLGWPREGAALEFRTEFFNTFNHPVFNGPNLSPTSSAFGTISGVYNLERHIQMALRMTW